MSIVRPCTHTSERAYSPRVIGAKRRQGTTQGITVAIKSANCQERESNNISDDSNPLVKTYTVQRCGEPRGARLRHGRIGGETTTIAAEHFWETMAGRPQGIPRESSFWCAAQRDV